MIFHVTTAVANPFKLGAMMEWSHKAAAFLKESHDMEVTILRNVAGSGDEWHFVTTHDSLGALEAYQMGVMGDESFMMLVSEARENELWSTTRTNIYRSVSQG